MSLAYPHERLQLPEGLRRQLHDFRRRVWVIKMVEATCTAAFAVVAAYLLMFLLDRAFDTPPWLRATLFVGGVRRLPADSGGRLPVDLAEPPPRAARDAARAEASGGRRPAPGHHRAGPQRLRAGPVAGALRGGRSRGGEGRAGPRLQRRRARAPAHQPGRPPRRCRSWRRSPWAGLFPAAARSAWARLLSPWGGAPRYTFAALEELPDHLVVAHGEPFTVTARLAGDSVWHPRQGRGPARRPGRRWRPRSRTAGTSSACPRRSSRAG